MNTIYKVVWNAATGKYAVASELAKGRKKGALMARTVMAAALAGLSFSPAFAASVDSNCTDTEIAEGRCESNITGSAKGARDMSPLAYANVGAGNSTGGGNDVITIGTQVAVTGDDSVGIGSQLTINAANVYALASNFVTVDASSAGSFLVAPNANGGVSNSSNAVAILGHATNATSGVAVGNLSSVTAANAVALGANSIADRANTVSVGNVTATRQIVNVGAGTQTHDAVNVSQLQPALIALGATFNADGTITQPTYTLANGGTTHTLGEALSGLDTALSTANTNISNNIAAITSIDGRVTNNETSITTIQGQLNNGTIGLVQQNAAGIITVAGATGGNLVDFSGTSGLRRLTGVENGVGDDDVVTMSQLKAAGLYDPSGDPMTVLSYDDHSLASATLGGSNGTVINNLTDGLIASGSMQAVNGGQLYDMQQNFQSQFNALNGQYANLDGRIGTIEQGIADGTIGGGGGGGGVDPSLPGSGDSSTQIGDGAVASGESSTAVGKDVVASGSSSTATGAGSQATGAYSTANGAGAIASGNGSTAVGAGAVASGTDSTALGSNSTASGNNSVALGAGSVADRDNTVSVGSEGNERQITNVAAGTRRTDAANWGQVQDAVNGVRDWADRKFHQMDTRINRMGAMSAAYGQMAFSANGLDTRNRLGVGVGTQGGQSALAVGYSRQIKPNLNLSFGTSASAGDVSVGAGMSYGW